MYREPGCISDHYAQSWDSSSYLVALSSFNIRAFVLSHCISFCGVWLLSLGGLLFLKGNKKGVDLGEREDAGSSRGKGNCLRGESILKSVNNNFEYRAHVQQTCHL